MHGTIAFLTMDNMEGYYSYDELCRQPLAERGWELETLSWTRPDTDWSRFAAVAIRSTWDYHTRLPEFLACLSRITASGTRLFNPEELVRWNVDKRYLRDLEGLGVPIVPTIWGRGLDTPRLLELPGQLATRELVIKPRVSANALDTFRLGAAELEPRASELETCYRNRDWMAQPFVPAVIDEGEFSLFFFDGQYSHTVLKTPRIGDFRVQEEHGGILQAVNPEAALEDAAWAVMDALPMLPLYARTDLVRSPDGTFRLMELELVEPSLYFNLDPGAPARFADALHRRLLA